MELKSVVLPKDRLVFLSLLKAQKTYFDQI